MLAVVVGVFGLLLGTVGAGIQRVQIVGVVGAAE